MRAGQKQVSCSPLQPCRFRPPSSDPFGRQLSLTGLRALLSWRRDLVPSSSASKRTYRFCVRFCKIRISPRSSAHSRFQVPWIFINKKDFHVRKSFKSLVAKGLEPLTNRIWAGNSTNWATPPCKHPEEFLNPQDHKCYQLHYLDRYCISHLKDHIRKLRSL